MQMEMGPIDMQNDLKKTQTHAHTHSAAQRNTTHPYGFKEVENNQPYQTNK